METGVGTEDSPTGPHAAGGGSPITPPPTIVRPRRRRRGRWILALTLAVLAFAFALGRWYFSGPRLANFVANVVLNPGIKGRVEIESIDWPLGDLLHLRHVTATATGVRIYAPDGKLVVYVPKVVGTVDAWSVMLPPHDVVVHDFVVKGGWAAITESLDMTRKSGSEIDFLAAFDARHPIEPQAQTTRPGRRGMLANVHGGRLEDVDVDLDFLGWRAELRDVDTDAWLWFSLVDTRDPTFMFELSNARVAHGRLTLFEQVAELRDARIPRFGILPPDDETMIWEAESVTSAEGAVFSTRGALGIGDPMRNTVAFHLEGEKLGGALERFSLGMVTGASASGTLDLTGPLADLTLAIRLEDADVDPRRLAPAAPTARVPIARVVYRPDRKDVELQELRVETLGGTIAATGTADFNDQLPTFVSELAIAPGVDIGAYLPPDLAKLAGGGQLSGKVRVYGSAEDLWANPIDLWLGTAHAAGGVNYAPATGEVLPIGLRVEVPEADATLTTSGNVNVREQKLALGFKAQIRRAGPLLRRLRLPAVATAAGARGLVTGPFDGPRVSASVHADGIPGTGRADARVEYGPGRLVLKELRAAPLGGSLLAGAKLSLGRRGAFVDEGWASASGLQLGQLP
jgi:hypothetical protein